MTEQLIRAVLPAANSRSFSVAVEAGIRYEALWRRVLEAEAGIATALVGKKTRSEQRRRKEHDDARGLRPMVAVAPGTTGRGTPAVHWHEGGRGPALLLLNGWTASGLVWPLSWVAELEKSYRVIRIDNRGTGWSRCAPAPFTMADLADDAADVLRACGVEGATVLGLSMGGMIAQELAMRHPDLVDQLILVGTRPPGPAQIDSDPTLLLGALRPPADGQDTREYIAEMWTTFACPDFGPEHPDVIDELVTQIARRVTPRQRVLDQVRAIAGWHGPERLANLAMPTTVVHGTEDPLMAVGNGMKLSRLIPDARYVELVGVGHLVPYEDGDALLTIVRSGRSRTS
ncbi:alpha/beta fold hydrolase [Gordonia rhizosphera]|uniref:alpha/beta fold hydrolase n=1 Tax=Gordonia rhizosphera TaxID=83341 RepID=UPI001C3F21D9|nr:alpha/beta hydrolase [Gordonia rhizosphera]